MILDHGKMSQELMQEGNQSANINSPSQYQVYLEKKQPKKDNS
jgi:hypothetical protein